MQSNPVHVVLIDECTMVRQGVRALLDRETDFVVVAEGSNADDAIALASERQPDVMIVALSGFDLGCIEATRTICQSNPRTKVIGISTDLDDRVVERLIRAGASGYVSMFDAFDELKDAVLAARLDQNYFSHRVTGVLAKIVCQDARDPRRGDFVLSERERQVLRFVSEGISTRNIADRLCISIKTVESHRKNVMDKLDIRGVAGLTKYAVREGITSLV